MKIFYSAIFDNEGISADNSKLRELEELGHSVVSYNYRIRNNQLGHQKRDQEIIEFCNKWLPDLIIFSKANTIDIRVFEECKKVAPVCYWFADPLITYDNEEYIDKTKKADFFICDKKNVFKKAQKINHNTYLVTDGFDRLLEKPKNLKKEFNVSFIGNLYGERKRKIEQIDFEVKMINDAYGEKHSERASQSRINLNFCTSAGPSDRVFKVLAAGGFVLTDTWTDIGDYFEDGKDLVVFNDVDDLNKKIKYFLDNEDEREKIAKSGSLKVQKYTRKRWAQKIIKVFNDLKFEKRHQKQHNTILFAGPWVGEFGWELFAWQAYVRSLSVFYDRTICAAPVESKYLYEDFCDDFVAFSPTGSGDKDSFYKLDYKIDGPLINKLIKSTDIDLRKNSLTLFTPRRIGDPPRTHFSEKIQFGPHYLSPNYKKSNRQVDIPYYDYVFHIRNRTLRKEDNWNIEEWKKLKALLGEGRFGCIGTKSESGYIEDTDDLRDIPLEKLHSTLNSAGCIFGPSSGPMHLASLYGCPHVVWSDKKNKVRYEKNWNPFQTPILFLDKYGWHPPAEYVVEKFSQWFKKNKEKG